jgi:Predicted nucleotide-binding protein containing TIR-like domain
MLHPVAVLARSDGPDIVTIQQAVELANVIQTYFRFIIESPSWLPPEGDGAKRLSEEAFLPLLRSRDSREPLVVITSTALSDSNFAFEYRDQSVISTSKWEKKFSPPPLKIYLIYQLAYMGTLIASNMGDEQHNDIQHKVRGCLFDESNGAKELRLSIIGAYLCAACEGRLSELTMPDEALDAINQMLGYVRSAAIRKLRPPATSILIGHGRAEDWKMLAQFLQNDLGCSVVEFNSDPTAGIFAGERILEMLDKSRFAFLVMSAEDEHADGSVHARQNVIHEIGLCQGRLGLRRSVILKEDKASGFSNIAGLDYIAFRSGSIEAAFPVIVNTLMREGLLDTNVAERALRSA